MSQPMSASDIAGRPAELERAVRRATDLYLAGDPQQAASICDLVGQVEFTGDYDRWTWIEIALALRW